MKAVAYRYKVDVDVKFTAPSIHLFKEFVTAFQTGSTPTGGFVLRSGNVEYAKAIKLVWCCSEAIGEMRREAILAAECYKLCAMSATIACI